MTRAAVVGVGAVLVALTLSGCQLGADEASPEPTPTTPDAPGTEPAVATATNPHVQDLWIYEQLRTVNAAGEIVDHTPRIVEYFLDEADGDEARELIPGMTFTPLPDVGTHLTGPDGEPRADAETVVGIVENELGAGFAVLGTVEADAEDPIGVDDAVFIDMSFLGDAIEVGDLMSADYTLVQLMPTGDAREAELAGLDLLSHRAEQEAVQYTGGADGEPALLAHELGRIVAGSEGPLIPAKAKPMMSGFGKGIKKCLKSATVGCIASYFKEFNKGSTESLKQLEDQLPIPPPSPQPPGRLPGPSVRDPLPCENGRCGKASGDPHLATFDGHRYAMQAVGEFVLAEHAADGVTVQIRTHDVGDLGVVSRVDTVAVGVGDQRIVVGADGVLLDGEPITDDPAAAAEVAGDGFTLRHRLLTSTVETETGHVITLERRTPTLIDVVVSPGPERGGWVGLLGDDDGDEANDLVARDGAQFTTDLSFDELYREYAASWRVSDDESLLPYADGETTATFTDLTLPREPFTVDDLEAADRAAAEAACLLAGVEDDEVLAECALDFALTGDVGYLLSAQVNDAIAGIVAGRLNPDGSDPAVAMADGSDADDPVDDPRGAWYLTGDGVLRDGRDTATLTCPPLGTGDSLTSIWGDGIYTSDSAVCRAAVHAGVITPETGGRVRVTREPGRDSYPSASSNGITSSPWGSWPGSFSVAAG